MTGRIKISWRVNADKATSPTEKVVFQLVINNFKITEDMAAMKAEAKIRLFKANVKFSMRDPDILKRHNPEDITIKTLEEI